MTNAIIPESKIKLEELIARYTLEPRLKDVYLEGDTDRIIIELFLETEGVSDVKTYDISVIDFSDLYEAYPTIRSNNREKLILLGTILSGSFNHNSLKVRCIIDKDFGEIISESFNSEFILVTDFSSLEGYIVERSIIGKILKLGFRNFPIDPDVVIETTLKISVEFFLIRSARIAINASGISLIDIDKACKFLSNGSIQFNLKDYITKICTKNPSIVNEQVKYLRAIEEHRRMITKDLRNYIHGHDFTSIFFKYVNVFKKNHDFREESFNKALYMSLEISDLNKYLLFKQLLVIFR